MRNNTWKHLLYTIICQQGGYLWYLSTDINGLKSECYLSFNHNLSETRNSLNKFSSINEQYQSQVRDNIPQSSAQYRCHQAVRVNTWVTHIRAVAVGTDDNMTAYSTSHSTQKRSLRGGGVGWVIEMERKMKGQRDGRKHLSSHVTPDPLPSSQEKGIEVVAGKNKSDEQTVINTTVQQTSNRRI